MSKAALAILLALVTGFACFQTWLNYELRALNDTAYDACLKPSVVEPVPQVFVMTASQVAQPIRRGTMR